MLDHDHDQQSFSKLPRRVGPADVVGPGPGTHEGSRLGPRQRDRRRDRAWKRDRRPQTRRNMWRNVTPTTQVQVDRAHVTYVVDRSIDIRYTYVALRYVVE
jgi:hypothetical protein